MMMSDLGMACAVVASLVASTGGCAAQSQRAQPAAPEAIAPTSLATAPRRDDDAPVSLVPPPPPPAPAVAAAAAPAETWKNEDAAAARSGSGAASGRVELQRAANQLKASAGDCVTACRALASMERATAHLCGLASSNDDRRVCEDARGLVLSGRDQVRASCGDCPGGPSVDRAAPIPSVR